MVVQYVNTTAATKALTDVVVTSGNAKKVIDQLPKDAKILFGPDYNLGSYINNFIMMIFVMGLVFEMPLLAWVLSKLGLITKEFLREYKKHAIVVLLVLAAVITPSGDPFTLSVVFLPLYLLYELSIKVVQSAPVEDEEVEEETEEM
jgi:sec-independent protein translocase protein TatC